MEEGHVIIVLVIVRMCHNSGDVPVQSPGIPQVQHPSTDYQGFPEKNYEENLGSELPLQVMVLANLLNSSVQ